MNDIYELKAQKYKLKYEKLLQELKGGVLLKQELDKIKEDLKMIKDKQNETITIMNDLDFYYKNFKEEFKQNIRYNSIISELDNLVAKQSKANTALIEAEEIHFVLSHYINKTYIEIQGDIEILQDKLKKKIYNANVTQQRILDEAIEELRLYNTYFKIHRKD